jgi:hypothetical protein
MVALITSTIAPGRKELLGGEPRSFFSPGERYEQTVRTVLSLKAHGIGEIFLVDNSDDGVPVEYADGLAGMGVKVLPVQQYQFGNKSVNEVLLVLYALRYLPDGVPVLKISGRYFLNGRFLPPDRFPEDFIVKPHRFGMRGGIVSTRCYLARDKRILEITLKQVLAEMYVYNARVVGPRSLVNFLKQIFNPSSIAETSISIEGALCLVLQYNRNRVRFLDTLGVGGAGSSAGDSYEE